jgi:hypothetical protein
MGGTRTSDPACRMTGAARDHRANAAKLGRTTVEREPRPATGTEPCKALSRHFLSGASRTRTGDLLGAIQALSQLSYSPAVGEV